MNTFIEENKDMLLTYRVVAMIIGIMFIVSGCLTTIGGFASAFANLDKSQSVEETFCSMPFGFINNVFVGLFALWCSKFIRFLSEPEYKQDWLLRNADKLLYKYATVILGYNFIAIVAVYGFSADQLGTLIGRLIAFILFGWFWPVVLVGLGFILKRIMPVIEESKTLV